MNKDIIKKFRIDKYQKKAVIDCPSSIKDFEASIPE